MNCKTLSHRHRYTSRGLPTTPLPRPSPLHAVRETMLGRYIRRTGLFAPPNRRRSATRTVSRGISASKFIREVADEKYRRRSRYSTPEAARTRHRRHGTICIVLPPAVAIAPAECFFPLLRTPPCAFRGSVFELSAAVFGIYSTVLLSSPAGTFPEREPFFLCFFLPEIRCLLRCFLKKKDSFSIMKQRREK